MEYEKGKRSERLYLMSTVTAQITWGSDTNLLSRPLDWTGSAGRERINRNLNQYGCRKTKWEREWRGVEISLTVWTAPLYQYRPRESGRPIYITWEAELVKKRLKEREMKGVGEKELSNYPFKSNLQSRLKLTYSYKSSNPRRGTVPNSSAMTWAWAP